MLMVESNSTPQSAEAFRKQLREQKRRAKLDEHRRAARLLAPIKDPPFSQEVVSHLRKAAQARRKAQALIATDAKGNRAEIKRHETVAKQAEFKAAEVRKRELDAQWLDAALSEAVALAQARGEDVEQDIIEIATVVTDENGARLVHSSGERKGEPVLRHEKITRITMGSRGGGVEHAFQRGDLDGGRGSPKAEALLQTGIDYGAAYEIDEGKLSSRGEFGGGFGPKGPQLRVVEAGEKLSKMRQGLSPRQRRVLDLVCGEKYRVRQAATMMKAGFPATARALRGGLALCMENWDAAKKAGEVGEAVERVRSRNRMLEKAR